MSIAPALIGHGGVAVPGDGSGVTRSARFIVSGVQAIGATDIVTITSWLTPAAVGDPTFSWDNIGFDPADYQGSGQFVPATNMELVIAQYALVSPATPATPGFGFVGTNLTSGALFDEEDFRGLVQGHEPAMNIPAGRRFAAGNGFAVEVHVGSASGASTIGPAAIYILQVGTF